MSGPSLQAGQRVLVQWADGQRYPAVVAEHQQGRYLCRFDNGSVEWVGPEWLTLAAESGVSSGPIVAGGSYAPAASSKQPAAKRTWLFALAGVALLVPLVGGFFVYRHMTKTERYIAEFMHGSSRDPEVVPYLITQRDDPRVREAFLKKFYQRDNRGFDTTCDDDFSGFDEILFSSPPKTPEFARALVMFELLCDAEFDRAAFDDAEGKARIAAATVNVLGDAWRLDAKNVPVLKETLGRALGRDMIVENSLVDSVVGVYVRHGHPVAEQYVLHGFPKNGAVITATEKVAPSTDERLERAMLRALTEADESAQFQRLALYYTQHTPKRLSHEHIDGFLDIFSKRRIDGVNLFRSLGSRGTAALEAWRKKSPDDPRVTEVKVELGLASPAELRQILSDLEQSAAGQNTGSSEEKRDAIDRAVGLLTKAGAKAVPVVIRGRDSKNLAVAEASTRALGKLAAKRLAVELSREMGSSALVQRTSASRATLGIELLKDTPGPEVDQFLILCLGVESVPFFKQFPASDAQKLLLKRMKAEQLVPAFFNHLLEAKSVSVDVIDTFFDLLTAPKMLADGSVQHVADYLEARLEEVGGNPSAVFWLTKYLAIHVLANHGARTHVPLLRQFTIDPGVYTLKRSIRGQDGKIVSQEESNTFGRKAAEAIRQITG